MNSFQWQMSMQVLNCLEIEDFIDCFGEKSGRWIWEKHVGQYRHDAIGFICYLDQGNLQKLFDFIMARINKMAPMTDSLKETFDSVLGDKNKDFRDKIIVR